MRDVTGGLNDSQRSGVPYSSSPVAFSLYPLLYLSLSPFLLHPCTYSSTYYSIPLNFLLPIINSPYPLLNHHLFLHLYCSHTLFHSPFHLYFLLSYSSLYTCPVHHHHHHHERHHRHYPPSMPPPLLHFVTVTPRCPELSREECGVCA